MLLISPFDFQSCCFSVLQTRILTTAPCHPDLRTTMSCKVTVKPLQTLVQGIQQVSRCITSSGIRLNPTNCNRDLVFIIILALLITRASGCLKRDRVALCWSATVLHHDLKKKTKRKNKKITFYRLFLYFYFYFHIPFFFFLFLQAWMASRVEPRAAAAVSSA